MKKVLKSGVFAIMSAVLLLLIAACGQDASNESDDGEASSDGEITIGLSVADLTLERWQHDRDIFMGKAEELGAEVLVQSADGEDEKQLSQIQNMLSQDIDVLVIIANNSDALTPAVNQAKEENIPVVAYDRLINNAEVDAYVSFDNERVGEMQAEFLVDQVPEGKYFLLGGAPTDNNAQMFRDGQMNVLDPLIENGDIEVAGDQWVEGWSAETAMSIVENGLTANENDIDAIVATNDSTAGGAVQALAAQNLAGDVAISGQDADLAAVQRIAEGTQSMTVYKPIQDIAAKNAEVAVQLAKGEDIEAEDTVNNGATDVPFIKLDPIKVSQDNLVDTVIADDFHSFEEVYENIPEDERPEKPE
ncbi:D-xylose ABC transporter substrate-binding protein [Lentibacillus salicampi]|uniref:D-xylose ABC transporter substrate-binding protein n=1 Tax=Lentibacillus salicampi TaxID=175306 RepID=A0A4Y9AB97_9BACI|nr:D-xylose ABC transporter substrate-binding protein [Lentibacillus salicampi]TFJ93083.1 D-xylose ABC transporter substrate-binding protein [Lentibacillus salicampi]